MLVFSAMKKFKQIISNLWSNQSHSENAALMMEVSKLRRELSEQSIANKILIEILNRIDKKVLAEHGISIKVDRPGRTVN